MSLPSIVNKNKPMDDSNFLKKTSKETSNEKSDTSEPPLWVNNPNILFDKDYIFEFYPTPSMSYYQKINTITRVVLLVSILLFIITRNIWIFIVTGITIFSIYVYTNNNKNETAKRRLLEGYENPTQVYLSENGEVPTYDEVFETPTKENPFSNVLIPDIEYNPTRKGAPPISNEIVSDNVLQKAKELIQEQNPGQPNIADKLFKNLNDKLDFEQSLRPFYSTASTTIPNDQGGFVDFCYGNSISTKEGNLFSAVRNLSHYTLY